MPEPTKFTTKRSEQSEVGRALNELSARSAEERTAQTDEQIKEWTQRPKKDRQP
jgi:hypothetical protein